MKKLFAALTLACHAVAVFAAYLLGAASILIHPPAFAQTSQQPWMN